MKGDFGTVVINEVPDLVGRDAPELRPFPKRADRRFLAGGKDAALAQPDDVGQLVADGGIEQRFHTLPCPSTPVVGHEAASAFAVLVGEVRVTLESDATPLRAIEPLRQATLPAQSPWG